MNHATVVENRGTAAQYAAVVAEFFNRYNAHDVDGMVELCSVNADFSYPPFEMWGKQRVLRGDGKVGTVGKAIWTGLITAFPNLAVVVHTIEANDAGDVVAQVDIGGTQQHPWAFVLPAGKTYSEPHLFLFSLSGDGRIESVTGYWNNAGISRQLGHMEVD